MVNALPAGARILAEDLSPWSTAISATLGQLAAYKSSDTNRSSANTGATFVNDPHLTLPVEASAVYALEQLIIYQAGATGQLKHQWTFPAGATMQAPSYFYDPSAADGQALTAGSTPGGLTSGFTGTGANVPIWFKATLEMGATAGTLAYQWAQTTSNATDTIIRRGSRMMLTRLA
jgi:hypothetical protein